jgi:hypothetical protein
MMMATPATASLPEAPPATPNLPSETTTEKPRAKAASKTAMTSAIGSPVLNPKPAVWELTPAEREEVSHSITQTWTEQAIRCYMSGADCHHCDIPKGNYSFTCQMNKVVPVLLEHLGQPDPKVVLRLFPQGLFPWMVESKGFKGPEVAS